MNQARSEWAWNQTAIVWVVVLVAVMSAWPVVAHSDETDATGAASVAVSLPGTEAHVEGSIWTSSSELLPQKSLFRIVQSGGPLMLPILFCSFILFIFVFERFISLRRRRVIPKPFVKKILHQLREGNIDRDEAVELCEKNRSPVATVFAAGIKKWGRPAVEVEQAILDAGERAANTLRRYLRLLNGVATVSPLLGLLGTVVGMIKAFDSIATANAMGRPELLAGGIGQALLTTAAGLSVAIPALIFYMFFISRVDRLVMDIDALGQELVAIVSADAEPASTGKRQRRAAA